MVLMVIGIIILVAFVVSVLLTVYGYCERDNLALLIGVGLMTISGIWMIFHP